MFYYPATDLAFEEVFPTLVYKGYDGAETCLAPFLALELVKETTYIGCGIVAVTIAVDTAETRGIYAWSTSESIDFQACIVGKSINAVML